MNGRAYSLLAPLAFCILLAAWIALSVANARAIGFSILIFAVANLIVYTDALDFALRLYMRRRNTVGSSGVSGSEQIKDISIDLDAIVPADSRLVVPVSPYAILASVFNIEDQLEEFIETFGPYRDRVWLISDGSTDNTVLRLTQEGLGCFVSGDNRPNP